MSVGGDNLAPGDEIRGSRRHRGKVTIVGGPVLRRNR